ncbi:MAG: hypothetical protein BWK78_09210 [Thiotrichaceae bacterium IS1]|nr:MAG: hypothetical protein BWK78_09210 [Thiotrichaceae bacterium IS1]
MNKFCFYHQIVILLLSIMFSIDFAKAELVIEPAEPTACPGESISLSIPSMSTIIIENGIMPPKNEASVLWGTDSGAIEGKGASATYTAPAKPEQYSVIAIKSSIDGEVDFGGVIVTVTPYSSECPRKCSVREISNAANNAAILIHSTEGSIGGGYNQRGSIDFMDVYQTLKARDYCDSEIYTKKYEDFTLQDVENSFEWAKQQSYAAKAKNLPEQPLLVVFIGYALPGQLLLATADSRQPVAKNFLGDFTGNTVVAILEAPYSGTLIKELKGDNRVIITSTGDNLSYYDDLGRISFTKFFFDQLLKKDVSYSYALKRTQSTLNELSTPFNQQVPRLEDSEPGKLADEICINSNNCCSSNDLFCGLTLTIEQTGPGPILTVRSFEVKRLEETTSSRIDLSVQVENGSLTEVTIIFEIPTQFDVNGYSRQPLIHRVKLREDPSASGQWIGSYEGFEVGGNYKITFDAKGNAGESMSDCIIDDGFKTECSITFTVEGPSLITPTK